MKTWQEDINIGVKQVAVRRLFIRNGSILVENVIGCTLKMSYNDHWLIEQVKSGGTQGFIKKLSITQLLETTPTGTRVQLAVRYKHKTIEDRWRIIRLK